jgi:Fur family transcriptional regulator, peroxide stress response regulator
MSRRSIQRDVILGIMLNTTSHPGADWVYEQARKEISRISLGTVYRNLRVLAQAGLIRELVTAGGLSRFDGNPADHYHFRCEKCGSLFDLKSPVDYTLEQRVAQETGFEVKKHYLEFSGYCCECKKRRA